MSGRTRYQSRAENLKDEEYKNTNVAAEGIMVIGMLITFLTLTIIIIFAFTGIWAKNGWAFRTLKYYSWVYKLLISGFFLTMIGSFLVANAQTDMRRRGL